MGAKGAALFDIRDGKVTTLVTYLDCERAFADLGLPSAAMVSRFLESTRVEVEAEPPLKGQTPDSARRRAR